MNDARVVLTVIVLLGLAMLGGLAGTVYLIDHGTDGASVATVSGMTGTALGALGGLLASTKTSADPAVAQAVKASKAQGAAETEAAVLALDKEPPKK